MQNVLSSASLREQMPHVWHTRSIVDVWLHVLERVAIGVTMLVGRVVENVMGAEVQLVPYSNVRHVLVVPPIVHLLPVTVISACSPLTLVCVHNFKMGRSEKLEKREPSVFTVPS